MSDAKGVLLSRSWQWLQCDRPHLIYLLKTQLGLTNLASVQLLVTSFHKVGMLQLWVTSFHESGEKAVLGMQ